MAGINFDATQVAPNVGLSPVEKGKYIAILSQSEFKPTANGAGKILALSSIVQGGPNHGRSIMINLNWENPSAKAVEIGKGQFSALCHAVNVLHVQDTQQLHNIPFAIEVDVTPDGKYNELLGFYPVSGAIPQAQPQQVYQQPVMQPQPQQFVQQVPQPQPQQFVAPQGQVNPMAQYEAMAQQPVQQPQYIPQPQVIAAPQSNDVPDWIKNQMAQQGQAPTMGNV